MSLIHRKKYVCKLCEMQFTCKRKIYKHLSTECHSHLLPFECKSCKVMLQNSNELEEHVKLHKKDYTSFFCEFCGQGFKNASILKYHKRIHTREIVCKCPICDKEFVRNSTLQLHIKVHLNEKPFKCDMCEKSFRENHILQAHIRVHTGWQLRLQKVKIGVLMYSYFQGIFLLPVINAIADSRNRKDWLFTNMATMKKNSLKTVRESFHSMHVVIVQRSSTRNTNCIDTTVRITRIISAVTVDKNSEIL